MIITFQREYNMNSNNEDFNAFDFYFIVFRTQQLYASVNDAAGIAEHVDDCEGGDTSMKTYSI